MGIEYIANVGEKLTPELASSFLEGFISQPGWRVQSQNSNKTLFMFTGEPLRTTGPEDFRVELNGAEVYVVFYGGNRISEQKVLRAIKNELANKGIDAAFEEP